MHTIAEWSELWHEFVIDNPFWFSVGWSGKSKISWCCQKQISSSIPTLFPPNAINTPLSLCNTLVAITIRYWNIQKTDDFSTTVLNKRFRAKLLRTSELALKLNHNHTCCRTQLHFFRRKNQKNYTRIRINFKSHLIFSLFFNSFLIVLIFHKNLIVGGDGVSQISSLINLFHPIFQKY